MFTLAGAEITGCTAIYPASLFRRLTLSPAAIVAAVVWVVPSENWNEGPLIDPTLLMLDNSCLRFGELAQLVEHRTFNPMVTRSIRVLPTNLFAGKK